MPSAQSWIESLDLRPHPEGGYFRETYRSTETILGEHLPPRFVGARNISTAIYFLLEHPEFSALHRIKQDEVWHFYSGSPLSIHVIDGQGNYSRQVLGLNVNVGQTPQLVIPAGCLFGATVDEKESYALAGCTVAPGFDFADFEMPGRTELLDQYTHYQDVIEKLTRQ